METYVRTYYPGVISTSGAVAVEVGAGASVRGIDIRIRRATAYHIRGSVLNSSSPYLRDGVSITLVPRGTSGFSGFDVRRIIGGQI